MANLEVQRCFLSGSKWISACLCNAASGTGQEVFGEYHRPFGGPEEEYGGQARVSGIRGLVALAEVFLNV